MGAKALLIHPSHQGVCGRHGTEDLCVTPGELVGSPDGTGVSDPISRKAKWEARLGEWSDSRVVPEGQGQPARPSDRQPGGLGKAAGKGGRDEQEASE